jgi:anti-sigma regulatory factor (Ser/Thr protein kinase)
MASDEPAEAGTPSVLDQRFDATSLSELRALAHACVAKAGMSADRATDIVIALHELAANAVRHGAGWGRLRIWDHVSALYCRVDDDGPAAAVGAASKDRGTSATGARRQNVADRWPCEPGHGLWLVRQVADRMTLRSDARGTRAVITFRLPARADTRNAAIPAWGSLPALGKPITELTGDPPNDGIALSR